MMGQGNVTTDVFPGLGQILRAAYTYWRPYWRPAVLIILALFLFEVFSTLFALSFKWIIDALQDPAGGPLLGRLLLALAGGFVITAVAGLCAERLIAHSSAQILNDLRLRMFEHLQQLPLEYFGRTRSGDILARFSSDLALIEQGLTRQLMHALVVAAALLLNMLALFWLEWRLALLTFACAPLITLLLGRLTTATTRASYHYKQQEAQLITTVAENLRSQPVVKAFSLQQFLVEQLRRQLRELAMSGTRSFFVKGMVATASLLSVLFIQLLVTGVGAGMAARGELSIGGLLAFLSLLTVVGRNAYELSKRALPDIVAAGGAVQRLAELLAEQPRLGDAADARVLPRPQREIRLEKLNFGYRAEQPVLQHVSLSIPVGRYVAFVGPSGSGKSSLLKLLARFYDAEAGRISIDGQDIRQLTQESLRAHMGVVFQESFLFDTSIRENLRLACRDASDAAITAAAQAAEIHETILQLPQGYDTMAGAAGEQLSGGQRQRLAIARALLRDPAILLLDEPTSALDAAGEAAVSATLERLAGPRTVIIATHRLAAVLNADRIFVLDGGRLVESGNHAALLARHGLYYDLWHKQQSGVVDAEAAKLSAAV